MLAADDNARDAPTGADEDALEERPSYGSITDSPVGVLLQAFVEAANSESEDARRTYEEAVKELRQRPEEVVIGIARALGSCPDEDYTLKWTLVHAAAELKHPAALPLLREIVMTPIPPERSKDPHSYSSVEDDTVLRTTAVDGVAELAKSSEQAEEALFEFLDLPSFSIRRAAVQGLRDSPRGEELRARLEACLPKDQRFLLDLKPVRVQDVEQVREPERFLSEQGRARKVEQPPTEARDKERSEGSPNIQRSETARPKTRQRRTDEEQS